MRCVFAALLCAIFLLPAGCDSTGVSDIRAALDDAQFASQQLDQVIDDAKAQADALPEGEQRDELLKIVETATTEKARVDGVITDLSARLDTLGEDADGVDAVAVALQTAGGVVPPPWGAYIAAGGSLLLAGNRWLKAVRTRRAAETVVKAIEHEKAANGGKIDFEDKATKASLRSRMGENPEALTLVERAREKVGPTLTAVPLKPIAEQR
jgi:hypothetical protein